MSYLNWELQYAEEDAANALTAQNRWEQVIGAAIGLAVVGVALAALVHGGFSVLVVFGLMIALIGAVNWEDRRAEFLRAQARIRILYPVVPTN